MTTQKSSIPIKNGDASATTTQNVDANASPLDVETKDGKLTVSVFEAIKPKGVAISGGNNGDDAKKHQSIEVNTKNGTLFVIATTNDDTLANIVLAKEKISTIDANGLSSGTIVSNKVDAVNGGGGGGGSAGATKPVVKPRRERVDFSRSSLERNFITPARAMSDFLLKLSDLESLPKTKRRSPYEQEPPIIVYWRKDVEAKAIDVWGSRENLLRECLKREIEKKRHQQSK